MILLQLTNGVSVKQIRKDVDATWRQILEGERTRWKLLVSWDYSLSIMLLHTIIFTEW